MSKKDKTNININTPIEIKINLNDLIINIFNWIANLFKKKEKKETK